jgi:hypothetical protein
MSEVSVFFTMDWAAALSNMIVAVETGLVDYVPLRWHRRQAFSHCGLVYSDDPERPADAECFECVGHIQSATGKNGMRGPFPLSELTAWQANDRENRRLALLKVPGLIPDEVEASHCKALWAVKMIEYSGLQLVQNLRGYVLRRGIGLDARTPTRWTCVEGVLRCLPPRITVPHFKVGNYLFDEYCPWGDRGPGLYQLLVKYQATVRGYSAHGASK